MNNLIIKTRLKSLLVFVYFHSNSMVQHSYYTTDLYYCQAVFYLLDFLFLLGAPHALDPSDFPALLTFHWHILQRASPEAGLSSVVTH